MSQHEATRIQMSLPLTAFQALQTLEGVNGDRPAVDFLRIADLGRPSHELEPRVLVQVVPNRQTTERGGAVILMNNDGVKQETQRLLAFVL
ncbi:hypothetical protein A2160_06105 [Candidatus Beckwithbacteria bacterium RBG_13_42_9]|uniref:Uncharacterized protein n=1 Tax=Candidatus Beckwithbacteria bacterium RBG_13_42_9 TaxID=1797457 RepID=A0A1F5E5I6_9BACT|nr:MAG: hypothetical protein A2160_06105 [Candidatus Beckwithbacteria bacterium RBG_13_42_9]